MSDERSVSMRRGDGVSRRVGWLVSKVARVVAWGERLVCRPSVWQIGDGVGTGLGGSRMGRMLGCDGCVGESGHSGIVQPGHPVHR